MRRTPRWWGTARTAGYRAAMSRFRIVVGSVLVAVAAAAGARAQGSFERVTWVAGLDPAIVSSGGPVHGDGVGGKATVTIEREPTTMRLQVTVFGAGGSLKDAADAL